MLIRSRQLVEQRSLAAVLVSCQCKGQQLSFRQWMLLCLIVVLSALSKAGMRNCFRIRLLFFFYSVPHLINGNPSGIGEAECQFIAVNPHFHRVSHRCILYHRHFRPRNDSHIEEVLPQRALSSYRADGRCFADRQFFQCHIFHSLLILIINSKYMTRFDCGQAIVIISLFVFLRASSVHSETAPDPCVGLPGPLSS